MKLKQKMVGVRKSDRAKNCLDNFRTDPEARFKSAKSRGLSRKESRRLERQNTKQRKQQYFSHSDSRKNAVVPHKNSLTSSSSIERPIKKQRRNSSGTSSTQKIPEDKRKSIPLKISGKHTDDKKTPSKKSSAIGKPGRAADYDFRDDEGRDEEDAYIEMLERRLGMKKKGKGKADYASAFAEDNLGGI